MPFPASGIGAVVERELISIRDIPTFSTISVRTNDLESQGRRRSGSSDSDWIDKQSEVS